MAFDLATLAERLLASSTEADNGCRRWTGAHTPKGYGQIRVNGRVRPVHVMAHEVWISPVPPGFDVDHVHANGCRHRDCIAPAHLEAVTHAENVRRTAELITHCPQGHKYTPENTRWRNNRKYRSPGKHRTCRRCGNDYRNAKSAEKRLAKETADA